MTIITRFAPSPTGLLHVGNVRTALINYLYARANKGKFILRIDDTDKERSTKDFEYAIKEDLEWLGLEWDEEYHQSDRTDLYEAAKEKMIESGRLYPCYETQEELEVKKKIALSRNLPPIYDRSGLSINEGMKENFKEKGMNPHYRFLMSKEHISWNDIIRGNINFDPKNISDPVLVKADGNMTYMIASVVDDIDLNITHIIRGEDHITNSAVHAQMFDALSAKSPNFGHLSLIRSEDGKISKRSGGFDISNLRDAGLHPMSIISYLAKIGSSDPIEYRKNLSEIIKEFNLNKFSKSSATYDIEDLERINTKLTHNLTFEEAKIQTSFPDYIEKSFWDQIRPNLKKSSDIVDWWKICNENIRADLSGADQQFVSIASNYLPETEWGDTTWNEWIEKLKSQTDRKGKELFMPIRKALTGMEYGPELKALLPILGKKKTKERLLSDK
jgi:glutamyl-tRNA synthetase